MSIFSIRDTAHAGDLCIIEYAKNGPCSPARVLRVGRTGRALEVEVRAGGRVRWGRDGSGFWALWLTPVSIETAAFLSLPDWPSRDAAREALLPFAGGDRARTKAIRLKEQATPACPAERTETMPNSKPPLQSPNAHSAMNEIRGWAERHPDHPEAALFLGGWESYESSGFDLDKALAWIERYERS
jgi:hypothetical protein